MLLSPKLFTLPPGAAFLISQIPPDYPLLLHSATGSLSRMVLGHCPTTRLPASKQTIKPLESQPNQNTSLHCPLHLYPPDSCHCINIHNNYLADIDGATTTYAKTPMSELAAHYHKVKDFALDSRVLVEAIRRDKLGNEEDAESVRACLLPFISALLMHPLALQMFLMPLPWATAPVTMLPLPAILRPHPPATTMRKLPLHLHIPFSLQAPTLPSPTCFLSSHSLIMRAKGVGQAQLFDKSPCQHPRLFSKVI